MTWQRHAQRRQPRPFGLRIGSLVFLALLGLLGLGLGAQLLVGRVEAQPFGPRLLRFEFTPTGRAQIAIWIEDAQGRFLQTVRLTEAVALRGIGNRPGATQMNSGFRWPYGRREAVVPIWATRRASAPEAALFPRVIFQERDFEGAASRNTNDHSPDNYFCLSFQRERSGREALDAVSCASVFSSDKGRYLTSDDVANGYAEPEEALASGRGRMRPLTLGSLYPPRRDFERCTVSSCFDHADTERFSEDAREVMPDIDAVTMATPKGGATQRLLFTAPSQWPDGDYVAWVEVHVEGDYNTHFNDTNMPTPTQPSEAWDVWAASFGYPYRGQPSVVYQVPFKLGVTGVTEYTSRDPVARSSWDPDAPEFGTLQELDLITNDPEGSPGSGADRLRLRADGTRLTLAVEQGMCEDADLPGPIRNLRLRRHRNPLHAHEWAHMSFEAGEDPHGMLFGYDVRLSTSPIRDDADFTRAAPAKAADVEGQALEVPLPSAPGEAVSVDIGGMTANIDYFIAVRGVDSCNRPGEMSVVEHRTPERQFQQVDPCFLATAAYGTPYAQEIDALRQFRDTYLLTGPVGRAFVATYYRVGPYLADLIREREWLRAGVRLALNGVTRAVSWWLRVAGGESVDVTHGH